MANLAILIDGVNLRADPTIKAVVALHTTAPRNYCTIMGTSAPADGDPNQWLEIRGDDGLEAWVRADVTWRVGGDLRLLGSGTYDTPVAGTVAFPPVGASPAQPPVTPLPRGEGSVPAWAAPLVGYTITEPYGGPAGHLGIDLAAPLGTPVYSRGQGVVYTADDCPACANGNGAVAGTNDARTNYGFGINVVVRYRYEDLPTSTQKAMDAKGLHFLFVRYAHLSKRFVSAAQVVRQGDLVGWLGTSGNSSGPHCHVELRASATERPVNVFGETLLDPNLLFTL